MGSWRAEKLESWGGWGLQSALCYDVRFLPQETFNCSVCD